MNEDRTVDADERLRQEVARHPYPLVFATISGAHLYGFPSPDSDYDLRGCHVLPAREVVGLDVGPETIESSKDDDGLELDLVTHDARKFFGLMLKKNGYVLEQLYSPLVVHTTPEHEELKAIARGCVTKYHAHHYFGFAETQWRLFDKERPRRVKPLLYVYRVLLTGIHLMRTGEVEANLVRLNVEAGSRTSMTSSPGRSPGPRSRPSTMPTWRSTDGSTSGSGPSWRRPTSPVRCPRRRPPGRP